LIKHLYIEAFSVYEGQNRSTLTKVIQQRLNTFN